MATVKFAVVDVGDFLSKKQAAEPDLATDWARLEELYNKKLWHQLTLKLMDFVKHSSLQRGDNLIQLYHNFLCTFENKINPLSLVEIVAHIIPQYTDKKDAVTFLEKLETKVKANDEALALAKVLQGQIFLEQLNDLDSTERIITDLEGSLEDADGVTPVHARFYKLASEYYRVRGPMDKYYRAALRYVGCSGGGANLPLPERRQLAFRLAIAAVTAPNVYDLGELLVHPILDSLDGSGQAWAKSLVAAVAAGDAAAVEALPYRPDTPQAAAQLRQKIAILCLMEMAFNLKSSNRRLTFAEIGKAARVPPQDVELLVMKALAENLIKGHIDQVNETVHIRWVRWRAVGRAGAAALAERLDSWCTAVGGAAALLQMRAPDLLTT